MDVLHVVCLEEIALEGKNGCGLPNLWQLLEARMPVGGIPCLTTSLKQQLWQLLKTDPASQLTFTTFELQAQARKAAAAQKPHKKKQRKKQQAEEQQNLVEVILPDEVLDDVAGAEDAGIVVVASEAARLSVVGVYDELEANHKLSEQQLAVLEMVGQRRHHGAVQTDMANALGIQHKNFFYVLKMLESRHMIVRNKLQVPTTGNASGWAITYIVHLPRFAPRVGLGTEAVFKEIQTAEGQQLVAQQQAAASGSYEVRDDATIMQQICGALSEQPGHWQGETQLKSDLSYHGSSAGHRQWRRLRNRLVKLGCIVVEPTMVGNKAIVVVRLVKPFKIRLPVVLDSEIEEEGEEAAGADEDGGDKDADDNVEGAEEGEGDGKMQAPVEVSRMQLLIEIVCEAGEEGLLTSDVSRQLGLHNKTLVRVIPELVRKYGLQVDYDMPKKALTNRLVAPVPLLVKYRKQQQQLLGIQAASTLPAANNSLAEATTQAFCDGDGGTSPQSGAQGLVQRQEEPHRVDVHAHAYFLTSALASNSAGTAAPDNAAVGASAAQAASGAKQSGRCKKKAANPSSHRTSTAAAAITVSAAEERVVEQQQQQQAEQQAEDMDVDATVNALLLSRQTGKQQQTPADSAVPAINVVAHAGSTAEGVPAASAAGADAEVVGKPPVDPAPATTAAVPVPPVFSEVRLQSGNRRLGGVSTKYGHAPAPLGLRLCTASHAAFPSGQQQQNQQQQPGGGSGMAVAPAAAGQQGAAGTAQAADSSRVGVSFWGGAGVSRLQQRRLQVLQDRLAKRRFIMKVEIRSIILNSELPAGKRSLYEIHGPDSKTVNRLVDHLIKMGAARKVSLQYNQQFTPEPKQVEVLLPSSLKPTDELLKDIAEYDSKLIANLRRDGMKRTWAATVTAAIGPAAAGAEGAMTTANAAAVQPLPVSLRSDAVAAGLQHMVQGGRSLPGFSRIPPKHTAWFGPGTVSKTRRSKGRVQRRKRASAFPAADDAAEDRSGTSDEEVVVAPGQPRRKQGAKTTSTHRNGYIPQSMLRAKLLHQYLCMCVGLDHQPNDDIPPLEEGGDTTSGQGSSTLRRWPDMLDAPVPPPVQARCRFEIQRPQEGQQQHQLQPQPQMQAGLFQLARPRTRAPGPAEAGTSGSICATDAAADDADAGGYANEAANNEAEIAALPAAVGGSDAAAITSQQALEQFLGGRLLSVKAVWLNMPLTLALSLGGSAAKITNLLQLVGETVPAPRLYDFSEAQIGAVFGNTAWQRVVEGLGKLLKMKLLTPAHRIGGKHGFWSQCQSNKATHLVIGTLGVLDIPVPQGTAPRLSFDFTQAGQWKQYWERLQILYDNPAYSHAALTKFFPANMVPELTKHRVWTTKHRSMPLALYLRLQAHLADLPIEQLDMHTAHLVAEDLKMPYQEVHAYVTRLRSELNEARERAGLERIYLTGAAAGQGDVGVDADPEDVRQRQIKWQQKQQRKYKMAKERKLQQSSRWQHIKQAMHEAGLPATAGETTGAEGAAGGGFTRRNRKRGRNRQGCQSGQQQEEEEDGAAASGTESDDVSADSDGAYEQGETAQQFAASMAGRWMPKITLKLAGQDRPEATLAAAGDAADARFDDSWDSDNEQQAAKRQKRDSAAGGDAGVPDRARQRHRWTPQQDRQLLRWLVAQRIEKGTRVQINWQNAAPGLPLSVVMCGRRMRYLKRDTKSRMFVASVEAQAAEVHKQLNNRRNLAKQLLQQLQLQNSVSANPLSLLGQQQLTTKQQQKQEQQQQLVAAGSSGSFLKPLPAALAAAAVAASGQDGSSSDGQQPQQPNDQAAATAAPGGDLDTAVTAAVGLEQVGPHQVTLQGDIVLLPDPDTQAKIDRIMEQIAEFTTPRWSLNAESNVGAVPYRPEGTAATVTVARQLQQKQRKQRRQRQARKPKAVADAMAPDSGQSGSEFGEFGSEPDEFVLPNSRLDGAAGYESAVDMVSSGDSVEEGLWPNSVSRAGPGGRSREQQRRQGSRQVRPLKTIADRLAQSAALLQAAAAAAAKVIVQRRAAGDSIGAEAVSVEKQKQLQRLMQQEKGKGKRKKRRQQPEVTAINGPTELIQAWKQHYTDVIRRHAPASALGQAATPVLAGQAADQRQTADAVASAANGVSGAAAGLERPLQPSQQQRQQHQHPVHAVDDATANATPATAEAVAAAEAAAAPLVMVWPYGPCPSVPVVAAMHLITSLLYLAETQGRLPVDASMALLSRFTQAEVRAAFNWSRALGWLNPPGARRAWNLSVAWLKRLRGDRTLADLLDRAPAAHVALQQHGLLPALVAQQDRQAPDAPVETTEQQQPAQVPEEKIQQQQNRQKEAIQAVQAGTGISSSRHVCNSLSALAPVTDAAGQFWVGAAPESTAVVSNSAAAAVPGALLLELVVAAAASQVELKLVLVQSAAGSPAAAASCAGEAAALLLKAPELYVQVGGRPGHIAAQCQSAAAAVAGYDDQHESLAGRDVVMADAGGSHNGVAAAAAATPTADGGVGQQEWVSFVPGSTKAHLLAYSPVTKRRTVAVFQKRAGDVHAEDTAGSVRTFACCSGETQAAMVSGTASQQHNTEHRPTMAGPQQHPAVAVGTSKAARQRAEAACLAAAAVAAANGMVGSGASQGVELGITESAGQMGPNPALVCRVLGAIRAAGVLGNTTAQVQEQIQQQAQQEPQQHGTRTGPQQEEMNGGQAALSAVAIAAVPAALQLLKNYGLVRQLSSWHQQVWVSSEVSQRLLAWPAPEHQQEPRHDGAAVAATATGTTEAPVEAATGIRAGSSREADTAADSSGGAAADEGIAAAAAVESSAPQLDGLVAVGEDGQQDFSPAAAGAEVLLAPWVNHKGRLNQGMWQGLVKRVMSIVMHNPGIPEPLLLAQLDVVAPAAAAAALNLLKQDGHLITMPVIISQQARIGLPQSSRAASTREEHKADATDGGAATSPAAVAAGGDGSSSSRCVAGSSTSGLFSLALQLGAGLSNITPQPAKPPSLLLRRRKGVAAEQAATKSSTSSHHGAGGAGQVSPGQQQMAAKVLHYWPSLTTSSSSHVTCMPPGMWGC